MSVTKAALAHEVSRVQEMLITLRSFDLATNEEIVKWVQVSNDVIFMSGVLDGEQLECQRYDHFAKCLKETLPTLPESSTHAYLPRVTEVFAAGHRRKHRCMALLVETVLTALTTYIQLLHGKLAQIQRLLDSKEIPQAHVQELTGMEINATKALETFILIRDQLELQISELKHGTTTTDLL